VGEIGAVISYLDPLDQADEGLSFEGFHREHGHDEDSKLRERNERCFSSQPYPKMPKEEVSEHAGEDMVVSCWIFPHLVVIHPDLSFALLKTLLDRPPDPGSAKQR
jgi:hypothetical protein